MWGKINKGEKKKRERLKDKKRVGKRREKGKQEGENQRRQVKIMVNKERIMDKEGKLIKK